MAETRRLATGEDFFLPVTVFVVPFRGTAVAMFGMTSCPCLSNDPGGGVAEPGGVLPPRSIPVARAWAGAALPRRST